MPTTAPALATMIGLGVGHRLRPVHRHPAPRPAARTGWRSRESIARTTATSGGAVLFAGGTVIIALLSLRVAGIPLVTTLGYTAAIVVLIAVLAATTLLPAMLACSARGSTRCRCPGCKHAPRRAPARLAALGAVRRRPPVAGDGGRRASSCSCSRARCATSTWARPTTARCPKDTQTRQAYDRMSRGFGAGLERPDARRRRADASRPRTTRSSSTTVEQQQKDEQKQQQQAQQDSSRPSSSWPGRAAAAGPAAGQPRGPGSRRQENEQNQAGRQTKQQEASQPRRPTRASRRCAPTCRRPPASSR